MISSFSAMNACQRKMVRRQYPIEVDDRPAADEGDGSFSGQAFEQREESWRALNEMRLICELEQRAVNIEKQGGLLGPVG